jgi:hypothetical protein
MKLHPATCNLAPPRLHLLQSWSGGERGKEEEEEEEEEEGPNKCKSGELHSLSLVPLETRIGSGRTGEDGKGRATISFGESGDFVAAILAAFIASGPIFLRSDDDDEAQDKFGAGQGCCCFGCNRNVHVACGPGACQGAGWASFHKRIEGGGDLAPEMTDGSTPMEATDGPFEIWPRRALGRARCGHPSSLNCVIN